MKIIIEGKKSIERRNNGMKGERRRKRIVEGLEVKIVKKILKIKKEVDGIEIEKEGEYIEEERIGEKSVEIGIE